MLPDLKPITSPQCACATASFCSGVLAILPANGKRLDAGPSLAAGVAWPLPWVLQTPGCQLLKNTERLMPAPTILLPEHESTCSPPTPSKENNGNMMT